MHLFMYFRSLKKNGVTLSPDELVVDNLRCIYKSEPEDLPPRGSIGSYSRTT